ncbi:intraflagellar transport protein 25 homolog [Hippocampus comes]|uniref:intraflagellar transport protein 25 homolog n=1 Tax=Hippocampus comes TaxID=109280 RepID=UPI00094F36EC|nr:PREDICTED: intraflagellar transport protein 25 homolog [Hippocampus comes]
MNESSIRSLGLKVVVAASNDENHPPENMIDGNANTFWMSTGMFPQEFIIRFAEMTNVSSVTLDSYNVKHLKVEKNTSENASHFEFVEEKELKLTEGQLQTNSISLGGSNATHLRFIITSGYDHFVAVHKIDTVNGNKFNC